MRIFGLKNCDTCRKATKALAAAGHSVTLVDVRADGLADQDRARFEAEFGDALHNRKSKTWREIDAAGRSLPPAEVIARYPAVMKRPVIEAGGRLYLGWDAEVQAALLAGSRG